MSVSERKFGALPTGEEVKIYHLENKKRCLCGSASVWCNPGEDMCSG